MGHTTFKILHLVYHSVQGDGPATIEIFASAMCPRLSHPSSESYSQSQIQWTSSSSAQGMWLSLSFGYSMTYFHPAEPTTLRFPPGAKSTVQTGHAEHTRAHQVFREVPLGLANHIPYGEARLDGFFGFGG